MLITIKRIVFALALLMPPLTAAAYDCFPSTWIPVPGLGTPYRTTTATYGYAKSWWCQLPVRQGDLPDKVYWSPNIFSVHNTDENLTLFKDAVLRVANAADPLKQANIEVSTASVVLVAGSQKEYEYRMLRYTACKDLQSPASWPSGVIFDRPTTEDPAKPSIYDTMWCGPQPNPPIVLPPPPGQYIVSGSVAYPLTATGTRSTTAWPVPPIKGEPCDASVIVTSFNVKFYRIPRLSTAQTVVAACVVKP